VFGTQGTNTFQVTFPLAMDPPWRSQSFEASSFWI